MRSKVVKGEKWRPNIGFSPVDKDAPMSRTQDVSWIEIQMSQRIGNAQLGQLRQRLLDLPSERPQFSSIEDRWRSRSLLFHELRHHFHERIDQRAKGRDPKISAGSVEKPLSRS